MWFMEETRQFSVGQTAQNITFSVIEKPHTELDHCLRMLQACFRKECLLQGQPLPESERSDVFAAHLRERMESAGLQGMMEHSFIPFIRL